MVVRNNSGELEFRLFRPDARQIFLVGDFNRWQEESLAMHPGEDGTWTCQLRLPEGVYHYRYLVDGQWYLDHATSGGEWCPFGYSSLVVMDEHEAAAFPVG
jgi:1,4-alpha-glucan branching enzyme